MPKKPVKNPLITINKEQVVEIEQLAGIGLSMGRIAGCLGMSKRTFERRRNEDPLINEAIHRGKCKGLGKVASTAYQLAISGKCPAMTMFFLKCQDRWKENPESEENKDSPSRLIIKIEKEGEAKIIDGEAHVVNDTV